MTKKLITFLQATVVIFFLSVVFTSCGEKDTPENGGENTEIKVTLPASVDVVKGEDCKVYTANSPVLKTDYIYLEKDGRLTACTVTEAESDHFAFRLPANFETGTYKVSLKRDERRVSLGNITINIVTSMIQIEDGTTVYGVVESAEGPIAGAVVSDGVETAVTDENGIYQLKSDKEYGYVFLSIPSGYEPSKKGVFPDHYRQLVSDRTVPENVSFTLTKVDQSNYKILFLGDMHLANRSGNRDVGQFATIAKEINNYVSTAGASKIYGITLGDMTWDLYWYSQKYDLASYANTINEQIDNLMIYHTIGNHDNDMRATGNWNAKKPFGYNIAPPYYSFNIGDVHYVVLDDVDCSAYIGDETRNQTEGVIYNPQFAWLAKDLQYVDKNTPIICMLHVPVFYPTGVNAFRNNMQDTDKLLAAFDGYNLVHYVTGHTHKNYNVVPEDAIAKGRNIYEHNVAAICADWWWSGASTPGLLQSTDGSPAGFGVWDIAGKDIKWIYKTAGKDENFQFRTYDLNQVSFSLNDVPQLTDAAMRLSFQSMISGFTGEQKNEVLINLFAMNSRWQVEVKTVDGTVLNGNFVTSYDPCQILANNCVRMNSSTCTSLPLGSAQKREHFYKVTAPDATTDLIITVKDEFGHTWTETMERPKKFDVATYKISL